jgi:hypothetical protein
VEALLGPFIEFGFMRRALVGCLALAVADHAGGRAQCPHPEVFNTPFPDRASVRGGCHDHR